MDADHWENLIKQNFAEVLAVYAEAHNEGMDEPVVVLIDPSMGTARKFCLANLPAGTTQADVDRALAKTNVDHRTVIRLAKPRQELNAILPPNKAMNPCDQRQSLWIVCMEGTKVFTTLVSQASHSFN